MNAPTLLTLTSLLAASTAVAGGLPPINPAGYVIRNVSVVPMTTPATARNRSVFVRGDRIVAIGGSDLKSPPGAQVIDGRGKFLIPGLCDMHVHIWAESELALYVANGVTLVRNMWGESDHLAMLRRAARQDVLGPRIVTAGRLVDGAPPIWGAFSAAAATPQGAIALMDEHQKAGFDFFKIYNRISLETFDAIAAHSQRTGFPFVGHIPDAVSLDHALRSGMRSSEHLDGWSIATLASGSPLLTPAEEPNFQARRARQIEVGKSLLDGTRSWDKVYSPVSRRALAVTAAKAGHAIVPTLIVNKNVRLTQSQAQEQLRRPEMRFMAPRTLASWNPSTDFRFQGLSDSDVEARAVFFQENLRQVAELHAAGAVLMAGTDAPNPFVMHGFSIHDELELFVSAGLTPFDALATATRTPAVFLRTADRSGTLEVNKRADMVLLNANPLENIGATRGIVGVMLAGRWLDRATLDAELNRVVAGYKNPTDWFASVGSTQATWTRQFENAFNDAPVGAERFGASATAAGEQVSQVRYKDGADVSTFLWRLKLGATGSVDELAFETTRALGTSGMHAKRSSSGIEASGADVAGRSLRTQLSNARSMLLCRFAVCMDTIIQALFAVDETSPQMWSVAMLDEFQHRLFDEQWRVTRAPETVAGTPFKIDAQRNAEKYTLDLLVANNRLVSMRNTGQMGVSSAKSIK